MLWFLFGCSQEPKNSQQEYPEVESIDIVENPILIGDQPERGVFVSGPTVVVSGKVKRGSSEIEELTLNGTSLDVSSEGQFTHDESLSSGIHQLMLRAEAEDGGRAVSARSIYAGHIHESGSWVDDGVRIQVNQALLDDGEPDLDDLASIAEMILSDLDIGPTLMSTSFEVAGFEITPTDVRYGDPQIAIFAGDPLRVIVEVPDLEVDFGVDIWVTTVDGIVTADSVLLQLDIAIESNGDQIVTTVENATSTFENPDIEIEYVPGLAEDLVVDWVVGLIETELEEAATAIIASTAEDYLSSFVLETELLSGVFVESALNSVETVNDGLRLVLDARVFSDALIPMPENAGSLLTTGAGPAWPIGDSPLSIALDDDILNQLMFAIWQQGTLSDISIDGILVEGLSGAPIPPPLGPLSTLGISVGLPPVLKPPRTEDMDALVQLGEWQMLFTREDGERIDMRIGIDAGIELVVDEENKVDIILDSRPAFLVLGVDTLEHPNSLDPGDISALGRLLVPSLLGTASNFLPSLDIPPIPMENISSELADQFLVFKNPTLDVRSDGWTVVQGEISAEAR